MNTFSILGDCVSRDIVTPLIDLKRAEVLQYHAFSNPLALFSKKGKQLIKIDHIATNDTNFRKRCAVHDINKTVFNFVFKTQSDYLIFDVLDARLPLLEKDGHLITLSNCIINARKILNEKFELSAYNQLSSVDDISAKQWETTIIRLCGIIKEHYLPSQIILHKHFGVKEYIANGELKPYTKYIPFIKSFNGLVKHLFAIIEENLKGCHIIEFPDFVVGDKSHQWGLYPLHYHKLYYEYGAKALEIIVSNLSEEVEYCQLQQLKDRYSEEFKHIKTDIEQKALFQHNQFAEKPLDILVSSDEHYIKYLQVLMASVYVNHPNQKCNFYVLHNGLSEESKKNLEAFAESYNQVIDFYEAVEEEIFEFNKLSIALNNRLPASCFLPLVAHKYLPSDKSRVLYLDIDAIVNGNLSEFYNLDFDDAYIIATKEVFDAANEPENDFDKFDYINSVDRNLAQQGKYFDSGVCLLNLEKLRYDKIDIDFYLNKIKEIPNAIGIQGILNVCFASKTKLLTCCKYNYRISFSARDYYNRSNNYKNLKTKYKFYPINAKVIHYCGYIMNFKPWQFHFPVSELQNSDNNFFDMIPECANILDIWWKYAKLTPDYSWFWESQLRNKSAYDLLKSLAITQNLSFANTLGLEILTVPAFRQKNSILPNDDLNDFVKPRVYRCANKDIKTEVKNLPKEFTEECGFRLTVKHINANDGTHTPVLQILETNNNNAAIYRRRGDSSTNNWGTWQKSATVADIEELKNEIFLLKQQIILLKDELNSLKTTH